MKRLVISLLSTLVLQSPALAQTPPSLPTLSAQVTVSEAWVRASVQGQGGTGAYMKLTAREPLKLVRVNSPVAGEAELHQMKMEGDVMKMSAVPGGLDLPAGKTVVLGGGGFHVMLMALKAALPVGRTIPITLVLVDGKGVQSQLHISVPVALRAPTTAPSGAASAAHQH